MSAFVFQPYQNQSAPTLATLMRDQGAARARAIEVGGQANANAALAGGQASADIGRAVGTTLANLVQIPQQAKQIDLAQKREALGGKQTDEALKSFEDKDLIQKLSQRMGNNPDGILDELKASGHQSAADLFEEHLYTARKQSLSQLKDQLALSDQGLKMAQSLLPALPDDATDPAKLDDFRTKYTAALPQIRKLVGDQIGANLPDPADPDLVTKVGGLHDYGMTAAEKLAARRLAVTQATQALAAKKAGRDADADFTKSLGAWLSTTSSQDEWDQALQNTKHLGAAPETLAKFGAQWSEEAAARAGALAGEKKPAAGSIENQIADALKRGDKNEVARLQKATAITSAARREPDKGPSTEATIAQKATAERWKADQLQQVEERYRASNAPYRTGSGGIDVPKDKSGQPSYFYDKSGAPIIPMTAADLEKAKAQVQKSYLAQIAAQGQPPAATTAPAAAAGAVPATVSTVLKGQKPGKYTLTDGTVWIVDKQGKIAPLTK